MAGLQRIKLVLIGVISLLIIAAVYVCVLVVEQQQTLSETSRYNVVWPTSQANTEFTRLEQRIGAISYGIDGIDRDEIKLRFDIIINRFRVLQSRDVRDFLASSPTYQQTIDNLGRAISAAQPLIPVVDEPGVAIKLLDILMPMDAQLSRLAAAANQWDSDRVTADQLQLLRLYWLFSSMAAGLVACGVVLVAILNVQNRWLHAAHQQMHLLTSELKSATLDLASANKAVQHANRELVAQNAALKERDTALQTQNHRFDAALNNMSQGLCMVDAEQRLIVCNQRFIELFGIDPAAARPGVPVADLARATTVPGTGDVAPLTQILSQTLGSREDFDAYSAELSDGRILAVSHQPMGSTGWVATYEDITARRRAEARIAHMAHHDALTDLPNRVLFLQHIELALARLHQRNEQFAVMCLDLDRFKTVNDTLGHAVGDGVLKVVGERLRAELPGSTVVCRLGGDEFAILDLALDQPDSVDSLASKVIELVGTPYSVDGHRIVLSTSIGIAVAPRDGGSADRLMRNADIALYRVKTDGRNGHRFFEPEMNAQLQARVQIEEDLRVALERGQFRVYFQPLIDLQTNRIASCEALVRWVHPDRGMISPAEFIRVAEEIGLIIPLGEWVLTQACREAVAWPADIDIAVNLSATQFTDRNLVSAVKHALDVTGLPPRRLKLEITESVLLQDTEAVLATLHELRDLGISIALDDFGTGYSSLSYLRSFPFNDIKIDQVFIQDIVRRADCRAIVDSIVTLGRSLGMVITAEGVETAEQVVEVRRLGCDYAQGYFYSRPLPSDAIALMVNENKPLLVPATATG